MADSTAASQSDQTLVAQVLLAEDRRAFEHLVKRHQGMVRAQLRRLLDGNESRADDLAQETFLLAWRKLHQFQGRARFSTWLYRIAYTCFLQARRKEPLLLSGTEEGEPAEPISSVSPSDLKLDLERAMRLLSDSEHAVLLHVAQLGLSHEEAAYVLGMPLGTVKSHAKRGKEKLRLALAEWQCTHGKDSVE